jgi:hypothetical protein
VVGKLAYGIIKETKKDEDQQAQTSKEDARQSPQEAHLAAVIAVFQKSVSEEPSAARRSSCAFVAGV